MASMRAEVRSTTAMSFGLMPWSMILSTSRGMARSRTTMARSMTKEKRASFR